MPASITSMQFESEPKPLGNPPRFNQVGQCSSILGVFGGQAYRTIYPNDDQVEYTVILFACELTGGKLAFDDETKAAFFVAPEHAPALSMEYPRHLLAKRPPPLASPGLSF